jgi:hypothetical protein
MSTVAMKRAQRKLPKNPLLRAQTHQIQRIFRELPLTIVANEGFLSP